VLVGNGVGVERIATGDATAVAVGAGGAAAQAEQIRATTHNSVMALIDRRCTLLSLQMCLKEPEVFIDSTGNLGHQISRCLIA